MSKGKSKTFRLGEFEYPTDWSYRKLDRNICDNLKIGDIVRLWLEYKVGERDKWAKYYFQIEKVDRYKYGGIHKIRKFHGKAIDIYGEWDWNNNPIIQEGEKLTWRKENILEIPGWNKINPINQPNKELIQKFINKNNKLQINHEYNYLWYSSEEDEN